MAYTNSQTNIKRFNKSNITHIAGFLAGVASKNRDLQNLDPQKTGYERLFITRMPEFLRYLLPDETKWFKHVLETMHTEIGGIGDQTMQFQSLSASIPGNEIELPTFLKDDTNEFTIQVPELSGSLIRMYVYSWLSGIADSISGYCRYGGLLEGDNPYNLTYAQCNHTMEAIYVSTDPTGLSEGIEFACLLTNMVPKTVKDSAFNAQSGQVNINMYDLAFTCNKYKSADINLRGKELLKKYAVEVNTINTTSGYTSQDINDMEDWTLEQ